MPHAQPSLANGSADDGEHAVGNGHLVVPVAGEDSWSDVSDGEGPSDASANYTLLPTERRDDDDGDDDDDDDDDGDGDSDDHGYRYVGHDHDGDGNPVVRSAAEAFEDLRGDDELTDAEFWARALDEDNDTETAVRGNIAAALTAATIIVTARIPTSESNGNGVPALDGVASVGVSGHSTRRGGDRHMGENSRGGSSVPDDQAQDDLVAVAAASARARFPPPERGPPVPPARIEAEDITLTDDAVDEIKTLMSKLPLPPGGLPPWFDAVGGGGGGGSILAAVTSAGAVGRSSDRPTTDGAADSARPAAAQSTSQAATDCGDSAE